MDEAAIIAALRSNPDLMARLAQAVAAPAPRQPQRARTASPAQLLGVPLTLRALERTRSVAVARTGTPILCLEAQVAHLDGPRVMIPKVPHEPARLLYPRKAAINPPTRPRSTPPAPPRPPPLHPRRSPSPRRSAPARETPPGDGPWPFSGDGSPHPPLLGSSDNANDDDDANASGPVVDEHPYDHPYYETPTSYEERTTNNGRRARGGRTRNQDGSLKETFIELLGDRKPKFDYTAAHTHPFATLHGLSHYNPYSAIKADKEFYDRVPKPKGLAGWPGRGGETKLHEELGLRMDMPFYNKVFRRNICAIYSVG
ncbi:hypothetical protein FRC10_005359, partial [Ceratobasidium sp. 414]